MWNRSPRTQHAHETEEFVFDDGFDQEQTRRISSLERDAEIATPGRPRSSHVAVDHQVTHHGLAARKGQQAVWLVFGVVETLLALRFLLFALAANPASPFFTFIIAITEPLVAPFANLIATPRYGNALLELGTAFAMIIYLLLAIGVAKLVDLLLSRNGA